MFAVLFFSLIQTSPSTVGYFCEAIRALLLHDVFRRLLTEVIDLRRFYSFIRIGKLDAQTVDDTTSVAGGAVSPAEQPYLELLQQERRRLHEDDAKTLKAQAEALKAEAGARQAEAGARLAQQLELQANSGVAAAEQAKALRESRIAAMEQFLQLMRQQSLQSGDADKHKKRVRRH